MLSDSSVYYHHYLLGHKLIIRLSNGYFLKATMHRIARWIESLSEFDFEVEYCCGKNHGNADGMSRCLNPRDCNCQESDVPLKCGPCHKCVKKTTDMEGEVGIVHRLWLNIESNGSGVPYLLLWVMFCSLCSGLSDCRTEAITCPEQANVQKPEKQLKTTSDDDRCGIPITIYPPK